MIIIHYRLKVVFLCAQWQVKSELRPIANRIQKRNRPAQLVQYPLTGAEPQSNPARIMLPAVVNPHKRYPYFVSVILLNPYAFVFDRDSEHLTRLFQLASHFYLIIRLKLVRIRQ